ncbi:GATOR complex protein NPRL2 [Achroia grisella]|uniref:GATOR complex protein NPRL2 n=1 Tax=Achroia grisella TaxID=688607 RepID=UPI0027D2A2FD|nr:GATOR complex protein NPRL2 [Achroia grisella]
MDANSKYYEGCGQEGPIRCIFLCEFHPTAGPKITCQVPENYISKDIFDTVSHYIIPKVQLQRCTLTVTLLGSKILGFPVKIDNKKYARNAFYFNLCFVCDAWARTVHLEPLVKKLTEYLLSMELETEWLSKQSTSGDAKQLTTLMKQVMQDINSRRMCTLTVGTTTTHLTVVRVNTDPTPVKDHQVPVFLYSRQSFVADQWDLTTNQILPYIDGFNHVSKIASLTDVEISLVRACVQNLVYYGVVTLVPIFQYCAVYSATPKLRQLTRCAGLQRQCVEFCARSSRQQPKVNDLFRMYAGMTYGSTVRDLCRRMKPQDLAINERKLVLFGVLEGLIRRVYKYPITVHNDDTASVSSDHSQALVRTYNGLVCLDELCCQGGLSTVQLEEQLERDSNVVFIVK